MTASGPRVGARAELLPRVASAAVMAALAIGTARMGGLAFDLFWLAAAVLVLSEWHGLIGVTRRGRIVVVGAFALAAALGAVRRGDPGFATAALAVGALAALAMADEGRRGLAAGGVFYAGVLALAVPLLRRSSLDGTAAVFWLFAVVWGTDTMAFFGGRAFGGPKLAPRLSPSKTWSGFAVGVGCGAALGLLVAPHPVAAGPVLLAGLAAGAAAQGGDLFESSLKRRFGAKDAGTLIPGHGGLMDRLDGFIAASALAASVGLMRFGPDGVGAGLLQW